jgi:hypothetical protein
VAEKSGRRVLSRLRAMNAHTELLGSWVSCFAIMGTHDIVFLGLEYALGLDSRGNSNLCVYEQY